MLVVDRVVLECPRAGARGAGTRRSRCRPGRAGSRRRATKSFRSGTCASTLLPTTRSALPPSRGEPLAPVRTPKNSTSVGTPRSSAPRGDVRGRVDPEHGNPFGEEVLQQVAVVGGELDDEALVRRARDGRSSSRRSAGVLDPGVRVGREVGVLAEDLLGRDERRQLREPAPAADAHVQRDRTAPSLRAVRAEGSSRRGATCRDRRRVSSSGVPQKRQCVAPGITGGWAAVSDRSERPRAPASPRRLSHRTLGAADPVGPPRSDHLKRHDDEVSRDASAK